MSHGYSIRFVDLNGRPIHDLTSDQTFRIELFVPKNMGDPGDIVGLEFVTSEGSADLTVTWTDTVDDEWVFTSTWLTVSGGGEGAGEVSIAGFSWSTGDLARGEIEFEDGAPLTVQFEHPDGDTTEDSVVLYDTPLTMGLALTAAYVAQVDRVFRNTLINIAAVRTELEQYPESGERDEIEAALEALEVETERRQQYVIAARSSIYREEWAAGARLAVARGYLEYLQLPPELLGNVLWTDALARERANKERSDEEVRSIVMRGIGEATIGAYRLFANATLVPQVRTLIFGENEMGQQVGWDERTIAVLDLITEAATMGASMRFELDHLVTPTQPRVQLSTARTGLDGQPARWTNADGWRGRARSLGNGDSFDAPRFQGDRLSEATTGDLLSPEQVGMMRQATVEAQRVARRPRDGAPDGTLIWTRPSNIDGLAWRELGHPPKGMEIKSKTINDIDVILGAEPGTQGLVGFFEPVLPPRAGFDDPFFAKVEKRFEQRLDEFNGTIGQHMRGLEADGQIRFDDGVVVDTGLYGNTGKGITGDYDLFEITDIHGTRVSPEVYDQIVAELMAAPAFQALHGAHMRWRDMPAFHKPAKVDENTRIFDNVVDKHRRGGEEPLIVFGGDRPAFAVWSAEVPPRHLADIQQALSGGVSRNLSADGIVIAGLSYIFADPDAPEAPGGLEDADELMSLAQAVLRRTDLREEDDSSAESEAEWNAVWDEWFLQLQGARRNPSLLDYLNESPYAPPPDDWMPGRSSDPDSRAEPAAEAPPASEASDPAWDAEVARANARLSGDSNLDHETGLDDYGDTESEVELPPAEDAELAPDADAAWEAELARAEARSVGSVLDHDTGIDEESGIDPGDPDPIPPEESVLNYLDGEPDLGATPVPSTDSVLDYVDQPSERPPSSPLAAIERDLAAQRASEERGASSNHRVPIWLWPAAAVAILAIVGFFAFGGGGSDDDPTANVASGGDAATATAPAGSGPAATATSAAPAATATPTVAPPTPGATMTAVQIPTLRICPDGTSFSGYEQPDGSFLDAETGEPRVCPPPPN